MEANPPVAQFLQKLWVILKDESSDIVSWSNDGCKFHILQPLRFESEVLGKHFRHKNLTSFQRQLNYFGFQKLGSRSNGGKGFWEYAHPSFVRDNPSALSKIKRRTACGSDAALKPCRLQPKRSASNRQTKTGAGNGNLHIAERTLYPSTRGEFEVDSLHSAATLGSGIPTTPTIEEPKECADDQEASCRKDKEGENGGALGTGLPLLPITSKVQRRLPPSTSATSAVTPPHQERCCETLGDGWKSFQQRSLPPPVSISPGLISSNTPPLALVAPQSPLPALPPPRLPSSRQVQLIRLINRPLPSHFPFSNKSGHSSTIWSSRPTPGGGAVQSGYDAPKAPKLSGDEGDEGGNARLCGSCCVHYLLKSNALLHESGVPFCGPDGGGCQCQSITSSTCGASSCGTSSNGGNIRSRDLSINGKIKLMKKEEDERTDVKYFGTQLCSTSEEGVTTTRSADTYTSGSDIASITSCGSQRGGGDTDPCCGTTSGRSFSRCGSSGRWNWDAGVLLPDADTTAKGGKQGSSSMEAMRYGAVASRSNIIVKTVPRRHRCTTDVAAPISCINDHCLRREDGQVGTDNALVWKFGQNYYAGEDCVACEGWWPLLLGCGVRKNCY